MKLESMEIEQHPLEPFLPGNARLLMLGSFPPQKKRWSMEFYYPNWNNDMWRITGFLFFNDKDYFVDKTKKAFCKERLISFLQKKGIALFDTASAIRRLRSIRLYAAKEGRCMQKAAPQIKLTSGPASAESSSCR